MISNTQQQKQLMVFLLVPILLFADDRLRLKRADVLENITIDGQATQILTGDVVFTKRDMTLICDRARYHEKSGQGSMIGNVKVTKKDQTLTCDSLHFDSPNDILKGFGNTHIRDADYDLVADSLIYYSELDSGNAMGNTRLKQKKQTVSADRLIYVKTPGNDAVSYKAFGNVIIREEDRIATCGEAVYSHDEEYTWLKINPQVEEKGRILSGGEIELQYHNEELEYMYIPSKAHVISSTTGWREEPGIQTDSSVIKKRVSFQDDMTSRILKGFFKDGTLDSIRLEGMATTLYHIFEDSVYQGNNLASGDTITMRLENNDLKQILISGGARGTFTPDSMNQSLNAPITYTSKIIDYQIPDEITDLRQNAEIKYTDVDLTAGFVNVSWKSNLLNALPVSPMDSVAEEIRPTLIEAGREPMVGDKMIYNLKTRRGKVTKGRTKAEDGFYAGVEIRNQDEETFFVKNGTYTTCDLVIPHFHFESRRMKMIHNDKVIVRPLFLYIGGIPLIGLPFAIFPHQGGGRHSGWIMPTYGESRARGQFIDGLGYYWALNPYWDTKFLFSFADRQGITLMAINRYKKRYKYSGNLHLETRQNLSGAEKNIWNLKHNRKADYVVKWRHKQILRREQTLNVDASFYSNGEYNRNTGLDFVKRMNQQAVSNATYTKRWKKSNNSLSINLSSKRDLMAEKKIDAFSDFYQKPTKSGTQLNITTNTLPALNFRHGQRKLIPTKSTDKSWYHNINWSYSSNLTNKLRTYYESEAADDTSNVFRWALDSNGDSKVHSIYNNVLVHNFSTNAPQKIFKYITVSPSLSIKSVWVNKTFDATLDSVSNKLIKHEKRGFATRTTGSFSLNLRTQIYGLFPIKLGALQSIRHVISPSIGYSFTPDFSKPLFGQDLGYFQTYKDTSGNILKHDRFRGTMAGSTPKSERKAMNISINNVFQAKLKDGEKERKIDLFSWQMSTNYNFMAEKFKLANLNSAIRTKIAKKLNLDLNMTHDFYAYNPETGERIPALNRNNQGLIVPRLLSARFSTGFNFSGKQLMTAEKADSLISTDTTALEIPDDSGFLNPFQQIAKPVEGGNLWKTNVSLSFAYNNSNPRAPVKTFWMNTNTSIQLTENWRVNYSARFNLIDKELVSHSVSLYRDLHCWELSLNWTPSLFGQGIYLKINVKSPTLRDLRIEQKGGIFQSRPNY